MKTSCIQTKITPFKIVLTQDNQKKEKREKEKKS